MKKCLVTGVTGLVGSHLLMELAREWEITGVSRMPPADGPDAENIRHVAMDLAGAWDPDRLPEKIDAVIHLAQSDLFRDFPNRAEEVFTVNTVSTLRLLDYARLAGAATFILASSGGLDHYGNTAAPEDGKNAKKENIDFYLATKWCSEILAAVYAASFHTLCLRFYFVYGPGQKRDRLIPRLIQSVKEGRPIALAGRDGIRINPVHVSDAVSAILRSLDLTGNHTLNVAGPEVLSLRHIGETIGQILGRQPVFNERPETTPRDLVGDVHRTAELLGPPRVKFQDGVRDWIEGSGSGGRRA
ncbi:MAG: NAD-dependent epimerase/dehydratase family protein [Nitrospinaceae bacterium]